MMTNAEREQMATLERRTRILVALLAAIVLSGSSVELSHPWSPELNALRQDVESLHARLLDAEGRIGHLEGIQATGTVTAPFEVVNSAGKRVFMVYTDSAGAGAFALFDASEKPFVSAAARSTGGFLRTSGPGTAPGVLIASNAEYAGISVRDKSEQSRLSLVLTQGMPYVSLTNDKHATVAALHLGSGGGGKLELGDADGNPTVRAGATTGGCGKVETLPERPAKLMGGIASFILGGGC
jgi:hypothetical protein